MRLSLLFSGILVLAASILTYAAPYGTPRTFLDIEQRSSSGQQSHHVPHTTSTVTASGSNDGSEPSETGVGRQVHIITRPLAGSHSPAASPPPNLLRHWAVMVGGFYYELHINNEIPNEAACSASLHGQNIQMNVAHGPPSSDWTGMQPKGWTHHTDAEIHQAGEDVMAAMSKKNYHILTNNCQDFATRLAKCIVTPDPKKRCVVV